MDQKRDSGPSEGDGICYLFDPDDYNYRVKLNSCLKAAYRKTVLVLTTPIFKFSHTSHEQTFVTGTQLAGQAIFTTS